MSDPVFDPNVLYTRDVQEFVRTRPWPSGLQLDVYEDAGVLNFVFYRDNFITFDGEDQLQIAMTVKEVMETLRKRGIPCYMAKMESRRG